MRKFTASPLLAQMPENEVMSGWITKVNETFTCLGLCGQFYLCGVLKGKTIT